MSKPDPLSPAHIKGQNPATPERLPGSTATLRTDQSGNEEELGGRPAFLFRSGEMAAVTLDSSDANLPAHEPPWRLDSYFTLGVRDVPLPHINPEALIVGIKAKGYYVWPATTSPSDSRGEEGA